VTCSATIREIALAAQLFGAALLERPGRTPAVIAERFPPLGVASLIPFCLSADGRHLQTRQHRMAAPPGAILCRPTDILAVSNTAAAGPISVA
jgi:hypothetical protein